MAASRPSRRSHALESGLVALPYARGQIAGHPLEVHHHGAHCNALACRCQCIRGGPDSAHQRRCRLWDYYRQRFERDRGLKIDFVLATSPLAERVTGAFIDREERAGQGASDHAPVVVDLD
jgi:endonuclease/exonuclease/phosphatase family metal-dependent hydrolase